MDYFSPSKHDYGEIHLYFKMIDKQFFTCINNMAAFILTQNHEKDNGIFQVSHKIYCSWAIISDLRQIFILKSQSRFIQCNYRIWGKETANICETFRHSASIFFLLNLDMIRWQRARIYFLLKKPFVFFMLRHTLVKMFSSVCKISIKYCFHYIRLILEIL